MSENQSPFTQPIFKTPLYMWLIIIGLIFTFIFCMFCKSTDLSGNRSGLVQNEVNEKIKALREDSVKKYLVVKSLQTWEYNLESLQNKLDKRNDSLVNNYNFTLKITDVLPDTVAVIKRYEFTFRLNDALISRLNAVTKLNNEYGLLLNNNDRSVTDDLYWDNNFTEEDKTNAENIRSKITNQLAIDYSRAFSISQSGQPFNPFGGDTITRAEIEKELSIDRKEVFRKGLESWKTALKNKRDEIIDFKENLLSEQKEVRNKIQGLIDETTEISSLSRDKVLLGKVLPVFTILILLLFAIPYIYRNVMVKDGDTETNVLSEIFSKGLLLKIFTVFLLTISILLLAIGDKIKAETIGTLLGGISVYILQNSFGAGNDTKNDPKGPDKPKPQPEPKPEPKQEEKPKEGA